VATKCDEFYIEIMSTLVKKEGEATYMVISSITSREFFVGC